uniref:Uncharacterized protein n=1 Tax=Rhizophora mucronata TaxID=61149 RepID=A0A2P2PER6_RHIMU
MRIELSQILCYVFRCPFLGIYWISALCFDCYLIQEQGYLTTCIL